MYKQLQGLLIAIETKIPDERAVIGCKITKKKITIFVVFQSHALP